MNADIGVLTSDLASINKFWDGKDAILTMRERDYQWRQMEWIGFYFEMLVSDSVRSHFRFPGDTYGNVIFDMKGEINWDIKSKVINSRSSSIILNDCAALDHEIEKNGVFGIVLGLVRAEYNDESLSFLEWRRSLEGGASAYSVDRQLRTSHSRLRKVSAELDEIRLLSITSQEKDLLRVMRQGRNSGGSARNVKYMLHRRDIDSLTTDNLHF